MVVATEENEEGVDSGVNKPVNENEVILSGVDKPVVTTLVTSLVPANETILLSMPDCVQSEPLSTEKSTNI